jgi:S1-C subfamily serine protease
MSTIVPDDRPGPPEEPEWSGATGPDEARAWAPGPDGTTRLSSSSQAGTATTRPTGQPAPPQAAPALPGWAIASPPARGRVKRRRAAGAAVLLAAALAGLGVGQMVQKNGTTATNNATAATFSLAQLEAKVDPALVDVVSTLDYGEAEAAGTGIVLTSSGEVVTNNHVVDGATSIEVTDIGDGKTYSATVVGYDVSSDIAVIKLKDASGLDTATVGNSDGLADGQSVVAIGNAGGVGGTPSAATGTVTALGQDITASDESAGSEEQLTNMIETDADVQAGDSGGPLVNMSGQIVGIDTAGSSTFQFQFAGSQNGNASGTDGFAIPINEAVSIAKQIESAQPSSSIHIGATAFLGVEVASTSAYNGSQSDVPGAAVVGVVSGSPAATAGMSMGDTITSVAGHAISSSTSLRDVLEGFHPGQKVSVTWAGSSGGSHTATVDLASGPTG